MMDKTVTDAKWLCVVVVFTLIAMTLLELYHGELTFLNFFNRILPTYISIGSWHVLRDLEKGKKTEPIDLYIWVKRYLPKRHKDD